MYIFCVCVYIYIYTYADIHLCTHTHHYRHYRTNTGPPPEAIGFGERRGWALLQLAAGSITEKALLYVNEKMMYEVVQIHHNIMIV